jgi:hypothetical protein
MSPLRLSLCASLVLAVPVSAAPRVDGTEILGVPSVPLSPATSVVSAGSGLREGSGVLQVDLPKLGSVRQVLLYWSGLHTGVAGDNQIRVNGVSVSGATAVGGPRLFFGGVFATTYRADVTALGLVGGGENSLVIDQLDFDVMNHGASLLALVDEGGPLAEMQLFDGQDLAFAGFSAPLDTTVPRTFLFPSSAQARVAKLSLIAGGGVGAASGHEEQASAVLLRIGRQFRIFPNPFRALDGAFWDHLVLEVVVPPGVGALSVQVLSVQTPGMIPAALAWSVALLELPSP